MPFQVVEPSTPAEVAAHIAERLMRLRQMADQAHLGSLDYLIEMALTEAQRQATHGTLA